MTNSYIIRIVESRYKKPTYVLAYYCVYLFLGRLADAVDDVMHMLRIVPRERPANDFVPSDMDQMSDEELLYILENTEPERPSLSEEAGVELHDNNVHRWTDGTVLKMTIDQELDDDIPEAIAMELVFRHTLIPVPRVRRALKDQKACNIWMDYIRGRQLKYVWPTLSFLGKLRIAFVLRRYIRQLRSIRHPRSVVPGPPGSGLAGRRHSSMMYGEVVFFRGPFSTYAELSAFWNERNRIAHMSPAGTPADVAEVLAPFDDSEPLVLTHGDLNLRNILVGDDGRIWLIDWADAGFYPPWFEFVNTRLQQHEGIDPGDWVWDAVIPFICGPYYKQESWYLHAGYGLNFK